MKMHLVHPAPNTWQITEDKEGTEGYSATEPRTEVLLTMTDLNLIAVIKDLNTIDQKEHEVNDLMTGAKTPAPEPAATVIGEGGVILPGAPPVNPVGEPAKEEAPKTESLKGEQGGGPVVPTVTAVSPSTVPTGIAQTLSISGSGFAQGVSVDLTGPKGIKASGVSVTGSGPTGVTAVATFDALGSWALQVRNLDGGVSKPYALTVTEK